MAMAQSVSARSAPMVACTRVGLVALVFAGASSPPAASIAPPRSTRWASRPTSTTSRSRAWMSSTRSVAPTTARAPFDVVETFVAVFPEYDQNRGMRRQIDDSYLGVPLHPRARVGHRRRRTTARGGGRIGRRHVRHHLARRRLRPRTRRRTSSRTRSRTSSAPSTTPLRTSSTGMSTAPSGRSRSVG